MKPLSPIGLLLPFALAACTSSGPGTQHDATSDSSTMQTGTQANASTDAIRTALPRFHWVLDQAQTTDGKRIDALFARADKPLTLDFSASAIGVDNACNRIGGQYQWQGAQLKIGDLNATMMACSDPRLNALDTEISQRLRGLLGAQLTGTADAPHLLLTTSSGDSLQFVGKPTAETRYGSSGEQVFMEIASERVACNHPLIRNHTCLRVRDITYNEDGTKASTGEWKPLYEDIEGYTFQPGIRNVVRLKKFEKADAPADASRVAYVLDTVVESETVKP